MDLPETNNGWFDVLVAPLRGLILPIYDQYRKRQQPTTQMKIPAYVVSDIRNTPVPFITEHRYDFGNGGVYGPPDMPVSRGIVNVPGTVNRQVVEKKALPPAATSGFYNGPQDNMEIFVYSPFSLPTNLPCSTSQLKY